MLPMREVVVVRREEKYDDILRNVHLRALSRSCKAVLLCKDYL